MSKDDMAAQGPLDRGVRPGQLKFPIDEMWPVKNNWLQRFFARQVAARILNDEAGCYQFGGWTGALRLSYELVDARKEQLAHWILRGVGYSLCTADLMELTGYDAEADKKPRNKCGPNGEVRGASVTAQPACEASSAEGATSTVVLGAGLIEERTKP